MNHCTTCAEVHCRGSKGSGEWSDGDFSTFLPLYHSNSDSGGVAVVVGELATDIGVCFSAPRVGRVVVAESAWRESSGKYRVLE